MNYTEYNYNIVLEACELYKQNKYACALELLETVKAENINNLVVKNQYYYCKATCYEKLSKYDFAIDNAKKSLEVHGIESEYYIRAYSLLGIIYKKLSQPKLALSYYEKALKISQNEDNIADIESNIGSCLMQIEQYDEALIRFKKALSINQKKQDCKNMHMFELNIAIANFYLSNIEESEKIFKKLLKFDIAEQKPQEQIFLYNNYAGILFNKKEYSTAIKYLKISIKIAKKYKLMNEEQFCLRSLGLVSRITKNLVAALKYYKKAIKLEENIGKNNINKDYLKMSFYQSKSDLYQSVVEICYELNKYEEAFIYSQKSKAKTFRELYNLKNLNVLEIDEIQRILNLYNEKLIIIDYFLNINDLYIFAIDKNNFDCKKVDVSLEDLNKIYEYYNEEVINAEKRENADIGEMWADELVKYLIDPITSNIKKQDIIYFVPQDIIWRFPLHALELNKSRIIEKYAVGYLNTISLIGLWQYIKGTNKNENIVYGVGDNVVDEARNVHQNIQGNLLIDSKVTKETVINTITNKSIAYFSCHGCYEENNPLKSGISLYDGIFTVEEINKLKINTDTIILSACESGLGTINFSNEIIGLTQAFLQAGVKTVIVTLWKVNIEATNLLMSQFTKELKNHNKIESLRLAQNSLINNSKFKHPYYNAGFILLGNWQ